jgi:hypothetical protein
MSNLLSKHNASSTAGQVEETRHLDQRDLARRWRISCRTLERWRWLEQGPPYLKIGGRVVYQLSDIEAYERRRRAETHSSIIGKWSA